ncbi:Crp/Fnr family transcriptional regulator [Kamptonema formosum]|uniref:Crp/Fnr family transcriptional regulator n=1 Tax=Kamptonema formosum TaxID=331992 RepID=UPI0003459AE9
MNHKPAELSEFIAQTQMFRGVPQNQLDALANIAVKQSYQKGEALFWEGDEGVGFFVVVRGRVKVFKFSPEGKEQILRIFAAGEHFAEVPAFDGQAFPASAEALEASEVLLFRRTAFLELLQQHPTLAINILAIFAGHLRRFAQLIEDLSLKEVPGRLAAYLLYLSEGAGSGESVELDITKGQLAAFLGTIPETLSRVFARLAGEKLIAIDGAKIKLLDREKLRLLAEGRLKVKGEKN